MRQTGNMALGWRKIILCLLLVSGSFSPGMTYALEYYVAKTGNDANSGDYSSPFLTIQKGMMEMRAGDTLLIKAGTYTDLIHSSRFTIPTGSSWANAPVIKAFPGDVVTVKPTGGAAVVDLAAPYIQYLIFEGLIFDAINGVPDISSAISLTNGVNHVRFLNIEARNATLNVVIASRGSGDSDLGTNYNEFIGGKYHHSDVRHSANLPKGAYVFYIMTDNNIFDGLEVHDGTGYGFHIWNSGSHKPSHNTIRNCRVHDNSVRKPSASAILLGTGIGNIAYNNLIYDNRGDGIQAKAGEGAMIYNNTIYGNDNDGIEIGDPWTPTKNTIIKNNISFANGVNNYTYFSDTVSGTIETHNIFGGTNPLFIDAPNRDFHLQHGSPAIDAGLTLGEIMVDFEGTARPQGAGYNIGALEGAQATLGAPKNLKLLSAQ